MHKLAQWEQADVDRLEGRVEAAEADAAGLQRQCERMREHLARAEAAQQVTPGTTADPCCLCRGNSWLPTKSSSLALVAASPMCKGQGFGPA